MDDETIRKIYRMFSMKAPSRQIALETGADEVQIKAMRRAWRNAGRPSAPSAPAGDNPDDGITPARDGSRAPAPVLQRFDPPNPEREGDENTPKSWQAAVRHGMAGLIAYTEDEIMAASGIADSRERTYAITSLLKILSGLYGKMGTWAGMDHPPEEVQEAYADPTWDKAYLDASMEGRPAEIPNTSLFYRDDVGGMQIDYGGVIIAIGGSAEAAEQSNKAMPNTQKIFAIQDPYSTEDVQQLMDTEAERWKHHDEDAET